MKIGTIAQQLGTTVRTLRFYEEQGLVHPSRSAAGTRVYDQADQDRFAALLALARLGFSLTTLSRLASIRPASDTGDSASRAVDRRLAEMDAELAARAEAIARQRDDLARARALLHRCHGCASPPRRRICDRCPVSAGVSGIAVLNIVWDEPVRD